MSNNLHRFFVEEKIENNTFIPSKDLVHQIRKVLRIKDGDNFLVISNQTEYLSYLEGDNVRVLEVMRDNKSLEKKYKINLIQSNIKNSKVNFILQKSTELGVDEITFVETKRSVVKYLDYVKKKERFEKIVREASEQSERLDTPRINILKDLSMLEFSSDELTLIFYAREEKVYVGKYIDKIKEYKKVNIIIGPEGGFSIGEIKYLVDKGGLVVSLGKNILRTETASLSALSVIKFIKGLS